MDVIATFLNCIKAYSQYKSFNYSAPFQKFKRLCLEFNETFGQNAEKNAKLQKENEKLKKTIVELKTEVAEDIGLLRIYELESENEKLKRTINQYESAFDVVEKEKERLEQELLELKEEIFGLKSFYGLPLKFRFRK